MDPRIIPMTARLGVEAVKMALEPGTRYTQVQAVLTDEESQLFNQLRLGAPCVICGREGTHAVDVWMFKFVGKVRSGDLFWKKDTHYYVKVSAVAPLCSKHYCLAEVSDMMCCVVSLIGVVAAAVFAYSMFLLKQNGHCILPVGDVATLIWWFIIGIVVFFVIMGLLLNLCVTFESVWKYGPLKRLVELRWFKCEKEDSEFQLNEARRKCGL